MKQEAILDIVSRIYDTALDPELWSEVLYDISSALGASGAMVFELTLHGGTADFSAPYRSKNYPRDIIDAYLKRHTDQELVDQTHFARLSGDTSEIRLVDDTEFPVSEKALRNQSNVQDMLKSGRYHRSGTLLNKDSWQIDRFAVQYSSDRGPSTTEEKKIAAVLLPHVAKSLRIGRPLMSKPETEIEFTPRFDCLSFGLCLLSPKGFPITTNAEFERIAQDTSVFQYLRSGQLAVRKQWESGRYQTLIENDEIHGEAGANPRRQSLFFENDEDETGLFIEICPISRSSEFGLLPKKTRLITVLDSSQSKTIKTEIMSRFFPLTKSETIVLQLVGEGMTNKEIADIRSRSVETINSQLKSLLLKTYTRNRTELIQLSLSVQAPFSNDMLGFS